MSRTIDERVVEMRFDNKEFERHAKTSMKTLSDLKEALNFTKSTEALENLGKATKDIKLDGIASGIEFLEKRFSTLGIVGMRVISNITDSLQNKLTRAIGFVTDSIVSGGIKRAMNIENAHFQLQALLKDETKVQAVMADAMTSVDGTAYAYDEAAKAAAQFAASGIEAGEQMLGALKGITGVAAMTNSDFESISRIFTTVAGNGRLMGDQLLQLSSRGLNAASTLADYFKEVRGQSSMTEATIREMVSKGKISFDDFAAAMTWAFGESAERANETFTGAFSNMKSALARIGAEFISPFIEQESDMVKMFNALRVQINNVKSALAFDEQKSAISGLTKENDLLVESVGKLVEKGTLNFEQFTSAILGTAKSEEELTQINQILSETYENIKKEGKASSEELVTFMHNGVNAGVAIRDYLNGALEGTVKVSDELKKSVNGITDGTKIAVGDVYRLAKEGKISYEIFTNAIINSSGEIQNTTELTTEVITDMMSRVKETGNVTRDALVEFNQNGMNAARALREYMNGVEDGSIRASYATTQAVHEITQGARLVTGDISRMADEGVISYTIFQSAMEHMYGDQRSLSKQFTDYFLDNIKAITSVIQSADLTKPMEAFYYTVESIKNVFKGLWSVVEPIGKGFSNVFNFSGDGLVDLTARIEKLTARMRLSGKSSKNLEDAFTGVFNVIKLLVDGFAKLFGLSTDLMGPVGSLSELIIALAGSAGRALTRFTEWARGSVTVRKVFEGFSIVFSTLSKGIQLIIQNVGNFGKKVSEFGIVQKIVDGLVSTFNKLGTIAAPYVDKFIEKIGQFKNRLLEMIPEKATDMLDGFMNTTLGSVGELNAINLTNPINMFGALVAVLNSLADIARGNAGIDAFLNNMAEYGGNLKEAFSLGNIVDKVKGIFDFSWLTKSMEKGNTEIETQGKRLNDTLYEMLGFTSVGDVLNKFRTSVDSFIKWFGSKIGPFFDDLSIGGAVAAGSGLVMVNSFNRIAKAFESAAGSLKNITGVFKSVSGVLNGVKGVLIGYQKDLQAKALIKVAAAIAILAGSLVLLSFADPARLLDATIALSMISGVILFGAAKLLDATKKAKQVPEAIDSFAAGLKLAMNNITKAIKWKAIASAFKDLGITIALIAGSIIALGLMYRKDPEALKAAAEMVAMIAGVVVGIIAAMSILGSIFKKGMKSFALASTGIFALSMALAITISALNKIFKMDFPADWQTIFRVS